MSKLIALAILGSLVFATSAYAARGGHFGGHGGFHRGNVEPHGVSACWSWNGRQYVWVCAGAPARR